MECLHHCDYDFSVEELIAVCLVAKVNVAVFTEESSILTYAGGFFEAAGVVTCCKLRSNRSGRTRSHFERLITTTELQQIVHEHNRAAEDAMLADDAQDPWDEEASPDAHEEPAAPSEADRPNEPAAPSAADSEIPGGETAAAPPPPPLPTDSARPRKRLRRKTVDANFAFPGSQNIAMLSTSVAFSRKEAKRSLRESGQQPKQDEQHFFHIQSMAD